MASSHNKADNSSEKSRLRNSFWRKHIDSDVVDLRDAKESTKVKKNIVSNKENPKIVKDIVSYGDVPDKTDSLRYLHDPSDESNLSDDSYVEDYLNEFNKQSDSAIEASHAVFEENLTKEYLSKELAQFDNDDIKIQEDLSILAEKDRSLVSDKDAHDPITQLLEGENDWSDDLISIDSDVSLIPKRKFTPLAKKTKQNYPIVQSTEKKVSEKKKKNKLKNRVEKKPRLDKKELKEAKKKALKDLRPRNKRKIKSTSTKTLAGIFVLLFLLFGFLTFKRYFFIQDSFTQNIQDAYRYMELGQEALLDFDSFNAGQNFLKARKEFSKIEGEFKIFGSDSLKLSASLPIQTKFSSISNLITAGKTYSLAGFEASEALSLLNSVSSIVASDDEHFLTDKILLAGLHIQKAGEFAEEASISLSRVRPQDIPDDFREDILTVQSQTSRLEGLFEETFSSLDILIEFLGHTKEKNYLLLIQNNSELRATGGFIGTYGLLRINKGNLESVFIEGIYYPDGQLSAKVIPPQPLQYVTPNWGTRDSNWFFDFPTSAKKAAWFYTQTGGAQTDGVIAITPPAIHKLLDLVGPIDMPKYEVTLTSENFLELVQQEVEVDYDKELNRPKQILADLTPILLDKLTEIEDKFEILNILLESLNSKDIMIYSVDDEVQEFIEYKNWDGAVDGNNSSDTALDDYLAVVVSNIGGWKTDLFTDTEVDSVTKINDSGEILRTVIISRKHNGGNTQYAWYNKPNFGYIRIYVPEGSELVSAEGFANRPRYIKTNYEREGYIEDPLVSSINNSLIRGAGGTDIFKESDKTVFGNWFYVQAGERQLASIKYKLPYEASDIYNKYKLNIQKQSGLDIDYSGSIEEFDSSLDISSCFKNGEQFSGTQFTFLQSTDTIIECDLNFD